MKNRFDRIAGFYDRLADLFFGNVWEEIQIAPASEVDPNAKILIVGGGTGRILPCLSEKQKIFYIELSQKMIIRARKRETDANVTFIHADYLQWEHDESFDAIIFPFFLDAFQETRLNLILARAGEVLRKNGCLHVIDFQRGALLQRFWVWAMYRFFRLTAGLEVKRLLNIHRFIIQSGYSVHSEQFALNNWVFYRIYHK